MSSKLKRRDLITYAFLSQGIYGTDDRLAGLLPFFHPIVETLTGEIFDPSILAQRVNDAYPWSINTDVAENLIPRFKAAGWLQEIVSHEGDVAYRYIKPDQKTLPIEALVATEEELHEIGDHFLEFAHSVSPLLSVPYDRDTLEELLLRWLVEKQAFDRDMIVRAVQDDSVSLSKSDLSQDDVLQNDGLFSSEDTYLCARFVDILSSSSDHVELFDKLVRISAVALVTEVVLDTQKPKVKNLSFGRGRVFYDSPFLLDLLECSGHNARQNSKFIHDHLVGFEAIPSVFSHSVEEARDNLRAVLSASVHERYGPTAESIRKGEVLEEYAKDVLKRFDDHLKANAIQNVPAGLELYPNEHKFFDTELKEELLSHIKWDNIIARERDVDSITYIMRKRKGQSSTDLTNSLPILLTKNAPLCSITTRFCKNNHLIGEYDIGPALHQRQLASVIWMLVGDEDRKELARRDLVRRCADVVRCRPDVVAKTREELRRVDLEKARQFEALVTRPIPTQLLMDLTLGARRVVTSENLDLIFQRLRESAAEDVQKRADDEMKKLKHNQRQRRAAWQEQLRQERMEKVRAAELLREEGQKRIVADRRISDATRTDGQMVDGWIRASKKYEARANRIIDFSIYGILCVTAAVGFVVAIAGTYPYQAGLVSAVATLVGMAIAIGEKTGVWPRIGRRAVFARQLEFVRSRATEADRRDLLGSVGVDHKEMKIWRKEDRNDNVFS